MREAGVRPGNSGDRALTHDRRRVATTPGSRRGRSPLAIYHGSIGVKTEAVLEFVDFTDRLAEVVRTSGIRAGVVNVQTRHTTTALMVNENEPLLQQDMRRILEGLAPRHRPYRHDDFSIRTVNLCPDEDKNGHSHCKAMFLRTSETLNVAQGELQLGQWQRVFLIELDRGKRRTVSVIVMGERA